MDIKEELLVNALKNIRSNLVMMADNNIGTHKDIDKIISRIQSVTDMKGALSGADFVVEAVSENLDIKQDLFRKLDAMCRRKTILATNTSVISITEIASKSIFRERIVGTHFWNPPYLIPLVEVVRGNDTADETMEKTFSCPCCRETSVSCNKDVPVLWGTAAACPLREAISLLKRV